LRCKQIARAGRSIGSLGPRNFYSRDLTLLLVADWSQAKIGYTPAVKHDTTQCVADWSQAKIGYTAAAGSLAIGDVADWSQAKIGYTDER